MATAKKTKKPVTKKIVPLKKKTVQKPVAKKVVSKKTSKEKIAPKKPMVAKKSKSQSKVVVKKTQNISKKVATKKVVAKKVTPKKTTPKKVVKSASVAKKPVKKTSQKVANVAVKKSASKPAPKKPVAKKEVLKKSKAPEKKVVKAEKVEFKKPAKSVAEKKTPVPKAVANAEKKSKKSADTRKHTISVAEAIAEILKNKKPKTPVVVEKPLPADTSKQRACAGIYFSIEDLDAYLVTRDTVKLEEDLKAVSTSSAKKKVEKIASKQVQVPKRALAAASIADILGFNPIEQSRSAFEEKDVPTKWKKYYKLLVEMKDRIQNGSSDKVESVSSSNIQLSHENSTQGMDVADIGAKNSERDIAFNLLSNEQNIISEVNAAIERIRNGTYGICEITGKQIPESRLLAVPFTRCTIEGQKQKEVELRRLKAGQRKHQYDVDLSSDNQEPEVSEDDSE